MKQLIIFLIRKRLGVKKNEKFQFTNQKTRDLYYFTDTNLMKIEYISGGVIRPSGVSLNWLLNDDCKITKNY